MLAPNNWFFAGLCVLVLLAPRARGQQGQPQQAAGQEQPEAPIPAYHAPLGPTEDQTEQGTTSPNTTPLSGAQYLSVGGPKLTHSYWQPRFDLLGSFDTNPLQSPNGNQQSWTTWTSFDAGVDIHHTSGTSEMVLGYLGGAMYSTDHEADHGVVQALNFTDQISFRRASVAVLDQFSYLPEQAFGFGGLGALWQPVIPSGSFSNAFVPGQSIVSGRGQDLINTFAAQATLFLSPRSSLTLVGAYSLLHFFDSNLLDYREPIAQVGYNYQISSRNTIAVLYTFSAIRYTNVTQSIDTHTPQLAFGRQVTGRLAFQIAAGPQFAIYRIPISGSSSSPASANSSQIYWYLNTATTYQYQRMALGLTYSHQVNGGSGVLQGSIADTVTGSVRRQMSRTFDSGVTAGYARNHGLTVQATPGTQTYDYWFAGVNFTHPIGTTLGLTFSYQMQYQNSNAAFCVGTACGSNVFRNLVSVGLSWRERPLVF